MKLTKGKIILIIVVFYFSIMAIKNINIEKNDVSVILDQVTIVEDGKVNKENEGKLVLVVGNINSDKEIYFEELDKPIKTIKATRKVEDYKKETKNGKDYYKWVNRIEGYDSSNILYTLKTETKTTSVKIGEFTLNEKGLNILDDSKLYHEMENVKELSFDGLYYSKEGSDENPKVDDMRISYNIYELTDDYMSILALQKNDTFEPYKIDKNEYYNIYNGKINTKELLKEKLNDQIKKDQKGKFIFILMILGIGIFFIVDSKKNKQ